MKIDVNGYPTLFRIEDGKVKYYGGNRKFEEMSNWYLNGGAQENSQEQMPGLLQDQQGGRHGNRRHGFGKHTRYRGKQYNRFHNQHKGTRKHFEKKQPGIFDFLFGK